MPKSRKVCPAYGSRGQESRAGLWRYNASLLLPELYAMKFLLSAALAAFLLHSPAHAAALEKVRFHPVARNADIYRARAGGFTLELRHADQKQQPGVWDSPLYIRHGRHRIGQSEELLITGVYYASKTGTLIVHSYSGSNLLLDFIDLRTGRKTHPQLVLYTEKLRMTADRIVVYPGCEESGAYRPSPDSNAAGQAEAGEMQWQCEAAKVLRLDAHSRPVEDRPASRALTRQVLGIAFEGRRQVLRPRTKSAVLLPPQPEDSSR